MIVSHAFCMVYCVRVTDDGSQPGKQREGGEGGGIGTT